MHIYFCLRDSNLRRERSLDSNQLCLCWLLKPNRFLLILLLAGKIQSIPADLDFVQQAVLRSHSIYHLAQGSQ